MTMHVEREQLADAHSTARQQLLALRNYDHWTGQLASSPLCTAAAVSALVLAERHVDDTPEDGSLLKNSWHSGMLVRSELSELLSNSLRWLAQKQNEDGGWGDADFGQSTLAATIMVKAAFHLTGVPAKYADLLHSADGYIEAQGGIAGLKKQFADDKPFVAAILSVCAMAGNISWRKVPSLPFEWACLPNSCYRLRAIRGFRYSLPLIISVGQAKHHNSPSRNPVAKWIRHQAESSSHNALARVQSCDGSFSASMLYTSFVIACLASQEQADTPIVRRGINFLLGSMRSHGSWAVCPDRDVSNTVLAIQALDWDFNESLGSRDGNPTPASEATLSWLLSAQLSDNHSSLSGEGGWPSSNSPGAMPNSFDTAGALLNLADWRGHWPRSRTAQVTGAALDGIRWLLKRQNRDGGWALAFRGSGKSAWESSSTDVTSQSMLALNAWKKILRQTAASHPLIRAIERGLLKGLAYLNSNQRPDGCWWPRWSGNELHPQRANPVVGTTQVLRVFNEMQVWQTTTAQLAVRWLSDVQYPAGGWGAVCVPERKRPPQSKAEDSEEHLTGSVEETSLAIEALLPFSSRSLSAQKSVEDGLYWLVGAISAVPALDPALVAFYPPKVWYYDPLLNRCLAVRALAVACQASRVKSTEVDAVSA
ncbi:Squalene--hopene cyclase [Bythopirellula polymerisocia]|uniref:Squalene--hopene cyclase n=2 Tax=Bythopirellula polymerisocia TaxID=2528003 RepID=A0A5C6CK36_9BACT|nr:Squalene--hopene cyclase [Bythopirellula polymerisocia]